MSPRAKTILNATITVAILVLVIVGLWAFTAPKSHQSVTPSTITLSPAQQSQKAYEDGLFRRIIGTNAVYHDESMLKREWYLSADVSNLFARIIYRLHYNRSLGSLLDDRSVIKDLLKRS